MAGGRWLVAAGSSVRFFLGLGTVTDSVSGTAKASAQSTSSSSSCRLARASTGEGPCSFRPSSQSAACLDCPAMSAGTLIINGPLRDPRHRSCSKLPTYGSQQAAKHAVRQACEQLPCNCQKMRHKYPGLLQPGQDHVVIRTKEQWCQLLNPLEVACITQNARNTTLPDDEFVEQCIARLRDACSPFTHTHGSDLLQAESIKRTIHQSNAQHISKYPWYDASVFASINDTLSALHVQTAIWDKAPCNIHGTCTVHYQRALATLTVTDPNFSIVAVETVPGGANRLVIDQVIQSADRAGVLRLGKRVGLWPKSLDTPAKLNAHVRKNVTARTWRAPTAFHLLKWKTNEKLSDWKWRLVVSHARHPLRRLSKLVGRGLTLLLQELHAVFPYWGCPTMRGVRDVWKHLQQDRPKVLDLWERDIDNAYWELNKKRVLEAVRTAGALVKQRRRVRGTLSFSIAKGGCKALDRVGESTTRNYRVLTLEDLVMFVDWDLNQNTLFEVWGVALRQAKRGVPIGGFLSAQLMCLWALVQENTFFSDPTKEKLISAVRTQWPRQWEPVSVKPGPQLTFPSVAWVPRDISVLHTHGMHGWFQPEARLLFTLMLQGHQIKFYAMNLWDSHPLGRTGKIVDQSIPKQQFFLRGYFANLNITQCMLADMRGDGTVNEEQSVLLTRYMDNMYQAVCNVPTHIHARLKRFLEILQHVVYNIKMKWEPEGLSVDWCDARLHSNPKLDLTIKGVPIGDGIAPVVHLWARWPDVCSQNCPTVLQSMLPSLTNKSCELAGSTHAIRCNIRAVIQGCGYKGYPWKWWWQPMRARLQRLNLQHHVPLCQVKQWYKQGSSWAGRVGHSLHA